MNFGPAFQSAHRNTDGGGPRAVGGSALVVPNRVAITVDLGNEPPRGPVKAPPLGAKP